MAGPRDLVVRFLADVSGFLRGTDDVSAAYRDIATDAEKAARSGETNADRLARAYRDAATDMGRSATAGANGFTQAATNIATKGESTIRRVAGKQMKSLGKGLAGDMASGISGFNPADMGGSIGSVLGSITSVNPFIAGATALGSLGAGLILKGVNDSNALFTAAGKAAAKALRDGFATERELVDIAAVFLGADSPEAAQDKVYDLGKKAGLTYAEAMGAALGEPLSAGTQAKLEALLPKKTDRGYGAYTAEGTAAKTLLGLNKDVTTEVTKRAAKSAEIARYDDRHLSTVQAVAQAEQLAADVAGDPTKWQAAADSFKGAKNETAEVAAFWEKIAADTTWTSEAQKTFAEAQATAGKARLTLQTKTHSEADTHATKSKANEVAAAAAAKTKTKADDVAVAARIAAEEVRHKAVMANLAAEKIRLAELAAISAGVYPSWKGPAAYTTGSRTRRVTE